MYERPVHRKSWPCTQGLDGCGRLPASSARIGKGFDDRVRAFVTGGSNDLPRCGMTCPFLVSIVSMFFFSDWYDASRCLRLWRLRQLDCNSLEKLSLVSG